MNANTPSAVLIVWYGELISQSQCVLVHSYDHLMKHIQYLGIGAKLFGGFSHSGHLYSSAIDS